MIPISQRANRIKPSPTLQLSGRVAALAAEGVQIISLGAGEPDFDTPQHIQDAAIAAIRAGATRYTPVDGTRELKQAVIDKFHQENQLDYTLKQVSVAAGAKHSLYNLFQALLDPGDEIIIPTPYWVSYPDMAALAEARVKLLSTELEQGFRLTPELLQDAIGKDTRLLVINSPSNPSGSCYTPAELEALGAVLLQHPQVFVVTDDIYEHILWSQPSFCNIVNACPELYERTVVVNGVSKAYAMTGWRIGYAAGPEALIQQMNKIQSQSTSNPCSVSQAAAVEALTGDQSCIQANGERFRRRHDLVLKALQQMPGVECRPADGTFYIFPRVQGLIQSLPDIDDDMALANFFLDRAKVAVVPGSAFGSPGYIRISFATSEEELQQAMRQMQTAIADAL